MSSHGPQAAILRRYMESVPAFSPATAKIVQLANNLNTPANEIVAAIRLDPVLTGKVLQLVNSAYFGIAQKVTSLNRALVYLGINTIKNLALSTAVMETFDPRTKELAEAIRPVWRHSLATAVCAKSIAKAAGVPTTSLEEYFIAGLLHDLGQIILMQAFFSSCPHDGRLSIAEEKKMYGLSHCEVGADTLRKWKFSDDLITAIADYHAPKSTDKVINSIHAANLMTYRLGLNGNGTPAAKTEDIAPGVWEALGLNEEMATKELASAAEQIEKAEVFLSIAKSKERVVES